MKISTFAKRADGDLIWGECEPEGRPNFESEVGGNDFRTRGILREETVRGKEETPKISRKRKKTRNSLGGRSKGEEKGLQKACLDGKSWEKEELHTKDLNCSRLRGEAMEEDSSKI